MNSNNCEIIFGSDGLIGTELKKIKSKNLFTVSRKIDLKKKNHFKGDINNLSFIIKIYSKIKRMGFKNITIFYLAGHSRTKYNKKNSGLILKKSINKLVNILSIFKGKNVRIVIASSGSIYKPTKGKLTESSKIEPLNFYSTVKFLEENIAREFCRNYGTEIIVGRIFSILSLNANNFFINDLKKKIVSNYDTLTFFGSGKQGRDYLDIKDVCKALKIISKNGKSDNIYNICSGKYFYMKQIINFFLSAYNIKKRKIIWNKNNEFHENDFYYGSNHKIKKLGFKPKILSLRDLLI